MCIRIHCMAKNNIWLTTKLVLVHSDTLYIDVYTIMYILQQGYTEDTFKEHVTALRPKKKKKNPPTNLKKIFRNNP